MANTSTKRRLNITVMTKSNKILKSLKKSLTYSLK